MTEIAILKMTFIVYAAVFGLAIVLTLAFSKTNWGRDMLVAILSWLGIFLLFVLTSYFGVPAFTALISLISILAVLEYYRLNGVRSVPFVTIAALGILVSIYAVYTGNRILFYAAPGLAAPLFFACRLFFGAPQGMNRDTSLGLGGFIYWAWLPFHFIWLLRLDHGFGYVVLLCTMIALNDNSAYYFGKLLGKGSPKLSPVISPGKTWVGFAGGTLFTVIAVFAFGYTVPHFKWFDSLGLSLLVAILIPIGDLIESAMKRDLGVKDTGTLIPGHGGVMDRFDSWIFTVPFVYYLLAFRF